MQEVKLSLFVANIILYIENPMETKKTIKTNNSAWVQNFKEKIYNGIKK